jgi:DNA-directed RNA polymerase specialized sigma24 family protein
MTPKMGAGSVCTGLEMLWQLSRGGESRAWLLTIVRHTCYTWLQHNRAHALTTAFDEAQHSVEDASAHPETGCV